MSSPSPAQKKSRLAFARNFSRSAAGFGRRTGGKIRRAAPRIKSSAVSAAETGYLVGRVVGSPIKRKYEEKTDPYQRINRYNLDIELRKRQLQLERLDEARSRLRQGKPALFRSRPKKRLTEIQRLRLELKQTRREVRRLRA
jgi:hypothetical protein